jgi:hypothetical protein
MQQHFRNLYHGFRENRRGMDLMFRLAKESNISVLFVHHFNKGKHPTVEGAIGGQGIIQNMTKAIYVMGQHPSTLGTPTRYLACERINAPPSLSFLQRTKKVVGYPEEIPFLEYTGIADVTSMDVFDASKIEERNRARSPASRPLANGSLSTSRIARGSRRRSGMWRRPRRRLVGTSRRVRSTVRANARRRDAQQGAAAGDHRRGVRLAPEWR